MIQAFIGAFVGVGLFLILADLLRIPFFRTSKAINNVGKLQEKKTSTLDILLGDLALWISKHLRINEFKRMQLEIDLRSAGVNMSPEMHIANSLVKAMLVGLLAIPVFFIFPQKKTGQAAFFAVEFPFVDISRTISFKILPCNAVISIALFWANISIFAILAASICCSYNVHASILAPI